jgi:hypothetical protein
LAPPSTHAFPLPLIAVSLTGFKTCARGVDPDPQTWAYIVHSVGLAQYSLLSIFPDQANLLHAAQD